MQAPLPRQSAQQPLPRESAWNTRPTDDVRLPDGNSWPLVEQPVLDWDWGPEEERRNR